MFLTACGGGGGTVASSAAGAVPATNPTPTTQPSTPPTTTPTAAQYVGPGWHAGSGAVFHLGSNALRPDYWTVG